MQDLRQLWFLRELLLLEESLQAQFQPHRWAGERRGVRGQVIILYPVSRWFYFRTVSLAQEEITLTKEEVAITLAKEAEQKTEELLLSQVCLHIN